MKYHANTLSAILSDWSSFENMESLYSQGSGSALQEAEKSANNWSGTLNKVSNSWTKLVSELAESDSIITLLNLVNDLIQAFDGLADASNSVNKFISSFGGLLGEGSSFAGNIGNIIGLIQSLTGHGENVLCPSF